jgi:hypothetical protein
MIGLADDDIKILSEYFLTNPKIFNATESNFKFQKVTAFKTNVILTDLWVIIRIFPKISGYRTNLEIYDYRQWLTKSISLRLSNAGLESNLYLLVTFLLQRKKVTNLPAGRQENAAAAVKKTKNHFIPHKENELVPQESELKHIFF